MIKTSKNINTQTVQKKSVKIYLVRHYFLNLPQNILSDPVSTCVPSSQLRVRVCRVRQRVCLYSYNGVPTSHLTLPLFSHDGSLFCIFIFVFFLVWLWVFVHDRVTY